MRSLRNANIKKGTRVIVRADFDAALKNGKISDDFRIRRVLPTLRYLIRKGAYLRLIAHLDRPGGKAVPALSLRKIARFLSREFKRKVALVADPVGNKSFYKYHHDPRILLFENIRFWKEEERNDRIFAGRLARWGDCYVNEAFANSHRAHASMEALPKLLPSYPGFNLEKEMAALGKIMSRPRRPLVALIGGAKLDTKMPVLAELSRKADKVLVGGVMVGKLMFSGNGTGPPVNEKLVLPASVAVSNGRARIEKSLKELKEGEQIMDIGRLGILQFKKILGSARTVVWNGPLGVAENPDFRQGTRETARSISRANTFAVVGGGDTIAILRSLGLLGRFSHISTGGGAMLEFLVGKKLPGIEALKKRH